MKDLILRTKKTEIITITLLYLVFFAIGNILYKDFGVSVDEWDLRVLGFVNLKYVLEIFNNDISNEIDQIILAPHISNYYGSTHGPIIALPMAFLEFFFDITDSQKYFHVRHYFNHLIFLISNFYFFLLVKQRFNNWFFGLLGALFLFLSPRIYAESFYNQKDIIFMSFFIINLYYGVLFLKKPSIKNSLLFSVSTAFSVDIRVMGILLPPIILFFVLLKNFNNKKYKIFPGIVFYLFLTPIFIFLFWPYLWSDPLGNFIEVFKSLSNYNWDGYVFYLGEYYKSSNIPWHYIFVWISISTPIFYLIFFVYGFVNYTIRFKNRLLKLSEDNNENDLWKGEPELQDLVYYITFISPLFIVIILNSTLYSGWRHLFFVYPLLLIIALNGFYLIYISYFKKRILLLSVLTSLFLLNISYEMINSHPYQNVFFNFISGKNVEKKFEMDYWGLSNKQAFEYILKNESKETILIGSASPISLINSKEILSSNHKKRIIISENQKADYIIDNYINWFGREQKTFGIYSWT